MPPTIGGVTIDPQGQTLTVSITPAAKVYTDKAGTSLASFPASVAARTSYWMTAAQQYTVSVKTAQGNEIADATGHALVVDVQQGVMEGIAPIVDRPGPEDVAQTGAVDAAVLHNTGDETKAGVLTFTSPPVVPAGSFPEAAVAGLVADLAAKAAAAGLPVLLAPSGDNTGVADLAAFIAAETAAVAAGRSLTLGGGTFYFTMTAGVTTQLTLRVPLRGQGQGVTICQFGPDPVTFSYNGFAVPSATQGYIADMTIRGGATFGRSVIPVNQGTYAAGTTYAVDDVVVYNSGSGNHTFISTTAGNVGNTPVNASVVAPWIDLANTPSLPVGDFTYGQVAMYGSVFESFDTQAVVKTGNLSTTVGPGMVLERVTVDGMWKNSFQAAGGSHVIEFNNCDVKSWGPVAVNGTDTYSTSFHAHNTAFRGDTLLYNNQKHNVYPGRQVALRFTNCRWYDRHGQGYCVHHHSSGGTTIPAYVTYEGCYFDATCENGILIGESTQNGIVDGNTFKTTTQAVTFQADTLALGARVSDNELFGAGLITTTGNGGNLGHIFAVSDNRFTAGRISCGNAATWDTAEWQIYDNDLIGALAGTFVDSNSSAPKITIDNLIMHAGASTTFLIGLQKCGHVTARGLKVRGSLSGGGVFRCDSALGATAIGLDIEGCQFRQTAGATFPTTVAATWNDRISGRDNFYLAGNEPKLPTGVRGHLLPRRRQASPLSISDGVTTSGSATMTSAAATLTAALEGTPVSGTGIPAGTTVKSVASTTSLTLSANATASNTGLTITFGSLPSAATITPSINFDTYHVSGTTQIDSITPHNISASPTVLLAWEGMLYLIADAAWSMSTAGNIVPKKTTARTAGDLVSLRYDGVDGKWYEVA